MGGSYSQTNLSRGRLANVFTRRHILYALLEREYLPPPIAEFVRSREFRRRFLYQTLLVEPDVTEATLGALDLRPEHLAEAQAYWRRRGGWSRPWLLARRIAAYAGYFGVSGLWETARVFLQRRAYRRATV